MSTQRRFLTSVPDGELADLPPRWDGHAVVWEGWFSLDVHICGKHERDCCDACGSIEYPVMNRGMVADDPAMTVDDVGHDDKAQRVAIAAGMRRKRRSTMRLTAFRCVSCQADTVLDDRGVLWDLDVSDYGPDGSTKPNDLR